MGRHGRHDQGRPARVRAALVYFDLELAKADATEIGEGIVTTIPRHNGHCVEWSEVWCAPPKPLVTPWG
jgi:hypothetical protein